MGLFDSLAQKTQATTSVEMLSLAEGVAAVAYLMVAADGQLADQELKLLISTLEGMQCFHSYSSEVIRRMFNKISSLWNRSELNAYLNLAVSVIPEYMGPTVFAVAADLAYVDGDIADEEMTVLEMLYVLLEVPQETALSILQVMQIRHKH